MSRNLDGVANRDLAFGDCDDRDPFGEEARDTVPAAPPLCASCAEPMMQGLDDATLCSSCDEDRPAILPPIDMGPRLAAVAS